MKKHICFVTKYYGVPKNGPSTFAHNFVKNIIKDPNYHITVISGESSVSKFGEKVVSYKVNNNVIDSYTINRIIKNIHNDKSIDLIYYNCFRNALLGPPNSIPYVLNVNDHHPFIKNRYNIWKISSKRIFEKSNKNFVNSEFTKNQIMKKVKINKDNFIITKKGINISEFNYKFNQIDDKINFLFVGSDFYRKGLDVIIRALSELKIECNYDMKIDIVGEDSKNLSTFKQMTIEYKLESNVKFWGRLNKNNIKKLHNDAHFFLLPSREEAFGVSIIEALASGTTVIATNTGGIPSIIDHDNSGVLININDKNGLKKAILELIKNKNKRYEITHIGHNKVSKFDFKHIYSTIYDEFP